MQTMLSETRTAPAGCRPKRLRAAALFLCALLLAGFGTAGGASSTPAGGGSSLEELPVPDGNRDGGDARDLRAGDLVQPAPLSPGELRFPQDGPVYEWVGADETAVCGKRLYAMCERQGGGAAFYRQGIGLWLDGEVLAGLFLAPDDLVAVSLRAPEPDFYQIDIRLNGTLQTWLPGTRVTLKRPPPTGQVVVLDTLGDELPARYDVAAGTLAFYCNGSGLYSIVEY